MYGSSHATMQETRQSENARTDTLVRETIYKQRIWCLKSNQQILKGLAPETQTELDENFCNEIIKGRKSDTDDYMKLIVLFGDIFCKNILSQRTEITTAIKNGLKFSKMMSLNMEAFMRTIIDTGCRHDWPEYCKSKEYIEWFNSVHRRDVTPVSFLLMYTKYTSESQQSFDNTTDDRTFRES